MELGLIIFLILICAMMLYLARNHFGKIFAIISVIFLILMIASIIGTFLIVKDLSNLKNDVVHKKSIFVIKDETKAYSAVGITPNQDQKIEFADLDYYNQTELLKLENNIKENKFEKDNGRIFVMTPEILLNEFELDLGIKLDEKDMMSVIKSDKPYDTLAQIITIKNNVVGIGLKYAIDDLKGSIGSDEKLKSYLTAVLAVNYFTSERSLVKDFKDGKIQILPETISFKLIKHTPLPTFE